MNRARRTGLAPASNSKSERRARRSHLAVTVSRCRGAHAGSGFVIVIEDTSDLLRAQKAAAWSEVARRIAHEIKNPLTPIALSRRAHPPPDGSQRASRCRRPWTKSSANAPRPSSTKPRPSRRWWTNSRSSPVSPPRSPCPAISTRWSRALSLFSPAAWKVSRSHVDLAPGLPPVNHRSRAVQAGGRQPGRQRRRSDAGFLPLKRLHHPDPRPSAADTVEIVVADTGCGITAEDKEKLFLPYFSTKGRGTGLGLAIVSHIVSEHNASIRVEDNGPGGAVYRRDSGRHRRRSGARRSPAPVDHDNTRLTPMKNPRILVVDDEPGIRQSLGGVLEDEGFRGANPSRAARPASTLSPAPSTSWCCSTSGSPVSTAWKPSARIQEIPLRRPPRVVMISGHGNIETAVRATKLGAYDFLEKPLSIDSVTVVSANAVEHRRLRARKQPAPRGQSRRNTANHRRKRAHESAAPADGPDGRHQRPGADLSARAARARNWSRTPSTP